MSTYSPSLRIELITTGDQAGAWGATTNTNLGTLIESAIAGYTSVSVIAADQAFTALNGAADESRNAVIALTTTTGANFNVYAPPAEKTYVIYNASSYSATIYNSTSLGNTTAAGTGVTIPAGKVMTVWSDGTNFAVQNNHFLSISLTTALAASSGGTGLTSPGANGNLLTSNGSAWVSSPPPTGMVYPGAGIAVSTGSAWTTSLTAPSGAIVGTTDTQTLTNKRITSRVSSSTSWTSPLAWNSDSFDQYQTTAQNGNVTISADAGTPTNGQKMIFRIKDNGTARTLTWTTGSTNSFRVVGTTLPTTTVANKTIYVGCIYNSADSRWDVVMVTQEV